MRKFEFIRPEIQVDVSDENKYGKFTITKLERGYGITIGNSLRRVLLSSMPGIAFVSVEIDGVEHEFTALDGVVEDVTEIILNLKKVILAAESAELFKVTHQNAEPTFYDFEVEVKGPAQVTAGDLVSRSLVKVVNPEQHIATVTENGRFHARLRACRGVGYVSAEENKVYNLDASGNVFLQRIAIDSIYTPIVKCRYDVEKARVGQDVNYDKLTMEIFTDGSIKPEDAMSLAAKYLIDHLEVISQLNEAIDQSNFLYQVEEKMRDRNLDKSVVELDLGVRAYNCLQNAKITTIGELVQKSEEELMQIQNLGRKSLKEIKEKLALRGLALYRSTLSDLERDIEPFDIDE